MRKFIFSAFILLAIVSGLLVSANAEIPRLINYQGRLTDSSGTPLNGLYNITFRIYDAESAGNLLWQGTYSSVSITKGIFNIMLGDVSDSGFNFSAITFDKPYWLEIKVGADDPMQPRQRITSAGYAIRAEKAEDANTVANTGVSTTPQANKLLPLDNNAMLPQSAVALKVYDSGWFAASGNTTYTKIHNLGTNKVQITIMASANADGSGHTTFVGNWWWDPNNTHYNTTMTALSTTQITVKTHNNGIGQSRDGGITSGYLRIVMLALE